MNWRIAADIAIGLAVPLGFAAAFAAGKVTKRELLFLAAGFAIGASFEFFTWAMGRDFFFVILNWPLPMATYYLCHSSWDAGIFFAGYLLCAAILRKPRASVAVSFDWREALIMTVWGAGTAFFVEIAGNGIIWQYVPGKWNPEWITVAGRGYTLFIQVVWLIAPAVFYACCLQISKASPTDRNPVRGE